MLRDSTQDLHRELEAKPCFARLLSCEVSVDDYRRALETLFRCYTVIEPNILQGLRHGAPDYPYAPRLPLLRQDLARLGSTLRVNMLAETAPCPDMGATLGALYVVEGSTLGGKLLLRHLQAQLGEQLTGALAFYGLDGAPRPQPWSDIKLFINNNLNSESLIEQAVEAACQTFRLFIQQADC